MSTSPVSAVLMSAALLVPSMSYGMDQSIPSFLSIHHPANATPKQTIGGSVLLSHVGYMVTTEARLGEYNLKLRLGNAGLYTAAQTEDWYQPTTHIALSRRFSYSEVTASAVVYEDAAQVGISATIQPWSGARFMVSAEYRSHNTENIVVHVGTEVRARPGLVWFIESEYVRPELAIVVDRLRIEHGLRYTYNASTTVMIEHRTGKGLALGAGLSLSVVWVF